MLVAADANHSGHIEFNELLAATMGQSIYMKDEYLKTAFDMIDQSGSGQITSKNLLALFLKDNIDKIPSLKQIENYMKEIS